MEHGTDFYYWHEFCHPVSSNNSLVKSMGCGQTRGLCSVVLKCWCGFLESDLKLTLFMGFHKNSQQFLWCDEEHLHRPLFCTWVLQGRQWFFLLGGVVREKDIFLVLPWFVSNQTCSIHLNSMPWSTQGVVGRRGCLIWNRLPWKRYLKNPLTQYCQVHH